MRWILRTDSSVIGILKAVLASALMGAGYFYAQKNSELYYKLIPR